MNRHLKALGLTLVAALALSALVSASASAQANHKFTTTAGQKVHLTAEAEGAQLFTWNTNDPHKFFSCNKMNIEKGKGTFSDGAEELTATPIYSDCQAVTLNTEKKEETKVSAFPTLNGCDFHFKGKTTEGNPTGGHHANFSIKCPVGKSIELLVTALKLKCVTIYEQEITDAIRYKNVTTEPSKITDLTLEFTPHNIKVKTLNTAACPTGTGKEVTHENGTYKGNVTVTGFKDVNHTEPTSVSVSPGTT